jgi:hypothetical protein
MRKIAILKYFLRKRMFALGCCLLTVSSPHAQLPVQIIESHSALQLENSTEFNADGEPQDDGNWQNLEQYSRAPLNLNTADEAELSEFFFLTPLQIQNFLQYRKRLGELLSVYELQAVPGWEPDLIEKIRPYITVKTLAGFLEQFRKKLQGGTHQLLVRMGQSFEPADGFIPDPASGMRSFRGSPQRYLLRYQYQYKNLLQYGLTAEKDAGEEFFRGSQAKGFDFYSAHLFLRKIGIVQALALGDFTVNMGQGLIQWQSLAFRKSAEITGVKRQSPVLRPYRSAGESNFHRGLGMTLAKGRSSLTLFASLRNKDANRVVDTGSGVDVSWVSSIQQSGLHRTNAELADRGALRQLTAGGNLNRDFRKGRIGLNGVQYFFSVPIRGNSAPYNIYALSGKRWGNYSVDYSYTHRNIHLFGELATDYRLHHALLAGSVLSVDPSADLCFVFRDISEKYRSLYANAFTESSGPANERGFYAGITLRPFPGWRLDAYADFYRFPWLRYQVDGPSQGHDYLAQLNYRPDRRLELSLRYRTETKAENASAISEAVSTFPDSYTRQGLRWHLNYKLNRFLLLRQRVELVWYNRKAKTAQEGYLIYADLIYKPMQRPFSGNIRLQYFESDDYDSRIYAFENDVLFSYSVPAFYRRGYRCYLNVNGDIGRKLSLWFRFAGTFYPTRVHSGSGFYLAEVDRKTDITFQLRYLF